MTKTMMDKLDKLTSRVEGLVMKEQHPAEYAGVEEEMSGEQSEPAAENGVVEILRMMEVHIFFVNRWSSNQAWGKLSPNGVSIVLGLF